MTPRTTFLVDHTDRLLRNVYRDESLNRWRWVASRIDSVKSLMEHIAAEEAQSLLAHVAGETTADASE